MGDSVEVSTDPLPCEVEFPLTTEHWANARPWIDVSPQNSDSEFLNILESDYRLDDLCLDNIHNPDPSHATNAAPTLPDPARSISSYIQLARSQSIDYTVCLCSSSMSQGIYCTHNSNIIDQGSNIDPPVGSYSHRNNPAALYIDRLDYMPQITEACAMASVYTTVRNTGLPNVLQARVPIQTGLNISAWEEMTTGHQDDSWVLQCLKYGFPIQYTGGPINNISPNHPSAVNHPTHIKDYIDVETQSGAMSGPFSTPPFTPWCNISPLMTRDKSTPGKKRVIVDLSYPHGSSVNDMVSKNNFMGFKLSHKLPNIQTAVQVAASYNFNVKIASIDIQRAYRNFPVCPLDWPLLVIKQGDEYYVDQALPFGTRMSSLYMQRIATFILRHLATKGIVGLFFLDDLLLIHPEGVDAYLQFSEALQCFHTLGLPLSYKKLVDPTSSLIWLGIHIDMENRVISIPQQKLLKFIILLKRLLPCSNISKVALMSLLGKINHFSQVIKPARLFMARLLATLRTSYKLQSFPLDKEAKADMKWMLKYMSVTNTRSMMAPPPPDMTIYADSCLQGGGGHNATHFYSLQYSSQTSARHHISQLEALNCLIALRTLGTKTTNHHIEICCDNSATIMVFTHHRGRDKVLNAICRALWFWSYSRNIHLSFTHIPGKDMILSDALSRRAFDPDLNDLAHTITEQNKLCEIKPAPRANDYSDFL